MRLPRFLSTVLAALATIALFSCGLAEPAMAISVNGAGLNLDGQFTGTISQPNALASNNEVLNVPFVAQQFTTGTAPGQIDTFYAAQLTISASSSTTLALNGSLTDLFGNTVNFLHVKGILLVAAAANTNACVLSPGGSDPFAGPWAGTSPTQSVAPGETALMTNGAGSNLGWAVVASTGMNLKVANSSSGSSVVCNIYIWGTST